MTIRPSFITDEIYHIYNRGVEKRKIFLEERDYLRFLYGLYEFNNEEPAINMWYRFNTFTKLMKSDFIKKQELVTILCFCLMPNHYHLLVQAKHDTAITEFMRKLGTGYTNYFNLKYKRSGVLFQGKFKAVHISSDRQLMYIPHYIHLNPLDIFLPQWKHSGMPLKRKTLDYLKRYTWSSYHDYIGDKKFPFLIQTSLIQSLFKTKRSGYKEDLQRWVTDLNFDTVKDIAIDIDNE